MEQILQKKHLKKINLFEQSIRSEETKKVYITCLKKYFEFPGRMKVIDYANPDGKKVENHIIDFVISLKQQGKGFAAISNYVSAICKYYKMNDVVLNTNKIHQYLPEFRKARKNFLRRKWTSAMEKKIRETRFGMQYAPVRIAIFV